MKNALPTAVWTSSSGSRGAWGNREMSGVRNILTDGMLKTLTEDAENLRAKKQINRLENIAVRSVEIVELWQEGGEDFITVKLYANLLDYTIDEQTGQVVSGSRTEPVKFNEYWTFTRPVGDHPWKLFGHQPSGMITGAPETGRQLSFYNRSLESTIARRVRGFFVILIILLLTVNLPGAEALKLTAHSAILMAMTTSRILYSHNEDDTIQPASITKFSPSISPMRRSVKAGSTREIR